MKLLAAAVVLTIAPGTALALDHIMKVGEVMVSNQGSTTSQFIELEDVVSEPFPDNPYTLQLFDAAGASIGNVSLTIPASTQRFLIATPTAATQFGVTAQATLTVTLPANGQACFAKSAGRIHCFGWGTITSQVIAAGNTDMGASPPDGQSIQRVNNAYALGAPTPGAVNSAPVPDASPSNDAGIDAPPAMPDAAVSIDAPSGNPQNPSDDDDGCSVGASASWFVLVGIAGLVLLRRRRQ
jgi:MYXO-CTERM domain-containing protein